MMKDYKVAQEYYYRMNTLEEIGEPKVVPLMISSDKHILIDSIVSYLTKPSTNMIIPIPSKSYAVALIYSTLIAEHFNEDFYEVLSDPDLLYGNDRNFVPYGKDTAYIYDKVIERVPNIINPEIPQTQATIEYFKKEFLSF